MSTAASTPPVVYPSRRVMMTSLTSTRDVTSDDSACTWSIVTPARELLVAAGGFLAICRIRKSPTAPSRAPERNRAILRMRSSFHRQRRAGTPDGRLLIQTADELQNQQQDNQEPKQSSHRNLHRKKNEHRRTRRGAVEERKRRYGRSDAYPDGFGEQGGSGNCPTASLSSPQSMPKPRTCWQASRASFQSRLVPSLETWKRLIPR